MISFGFLRSLSSGGASVGAGVRLAGLTHFQKMIVF